MALQQSQKRDTSATGGRQKDAAVSDPPMEVSGRPHWPASSVEMRPLSALRRYEGNAKLHPPEQIEQLRASFREFGWTIPLLVREDGTLIAGHGRVEAAELEGFTEVPVMVARGWTEAQCRAYTLADNRLTELGEWDEDLLKLELGQLGASGYDLALTGFTGADLEKALAGREPTDGIEDAPECRYSEQYGVIVLCADEADQQSVFERLKADGLTVRVVAT